MQKYQTLVRILDSLCAEAPPEHMRYHPKAADTAGIERARSLTLAHLFLKAKFGLTTFADRVAYVTDDAQDGGVDAYYIDELSRQIYFVQSKFRNNAAGFQSRAIVATDLLRMDVDRITEGATTDVHGRSYNSKILRLIERLQSIHDIARYKYNVIVIANVRQIDGRQLRKLVGGFDVSVFDESRCFNELVFPVVNGTYYNIDDLTIDIDLSKKELTQSRISYPVDAGDIECEITLLFVPTLQIAKVLEKYRNSILRYNPRTYLGLSGNAVNREIAGTIVNRSGNEFALFNNGITLLSDETRFSERTGRPRLGQLHVRNPQIINGGQTAFTLSELYAQHAATNDLSVFDNKEVMVRIITIAEATEERKRLRLIEAISKATNQQTKIVEADRRANDSVQILLQKHLYERFGYFYERKAGEFYDGLTNGYIDERYIVKRAVLLRIAYALSKRPNIATSRASSELFGADDFVSILNTVLDSDHPFFAYRVHDVLSRAATKRGRKTLAISERSLSILLNIGNGLHAGRYAIVLVAGRTIDPLPDDLSDDLAVVNAVEPILKRWPDFEKRARENPANHSYFRRIRDARGKELIEARYGAYYSSQNVVHDLKAFFSFD